jgi:hypothetical protein
MLFRDEAPGPFCDLSPEYLEFVRRMFKLDGPRWSERPMQS